MASLIPHLDAPSTYVDRNNKVPGLELRQRLENSSTLYIGNLSFYTTEEQIYELFSKCGEIKRIIMGLDRNTRTPCGFCFVEYYHAADARDCMKYVNGTKLDERVIRSDVDPGFKEGRQFGRGKSGGQVRDEYRQEYDAGRGGWGAIRAQQEKEREKMQKEKYEENLDIAKGAQGYRLAQQAQETTGKRAAEEPQEAQPNPRFRGRREEDDEDM